MRSAQDEPHSARPSAHHNGTDPPRLTFDARLEKRKTGRRVAAGRFRSLCNHIKNQLSRTILRRRACCRRSAWRRRHAECCTGPQRIIAAVRWAKLPWCCALRHERQSWGKFEVISRVRAPRTCLASTSCAPPARALTACVRFPLLRYDVSRLSSVLRRDGRRIRSRLLGWSAVCAGSCSGAVYGCARWQDGGA